MNGTSIVLFDGVCNLCNSAVLFIIDRDKRGRFRFAPLQSEFATQLLTDLGEPVPEAGPDSIILIEDERVYLRSDAALRIARQLDGLWSLASVYLVVPRAVRDWVYDVIARNRYRWFGREEACRIPTAELRQRFLA